jgi:serine acetyltransferase
MRVGRNTWHGPDVILDDRGGLEIGEGAVIGAVSYVNRQFPVGMTARDVPARIKSP